MHEAELNYRKNRFPMFLTLTRNCYFVILDLPIGRGDSHSLFALQPYLARRSEPGH